MSIKNLDSNTLREMFHYGLTVLEQNKQLVDSLNVFPVPDGDTGSNMALTLQSAIRELDKTESDRACDVVEALSKGALKGARGNSGVILSQLFRGLYKGIKDKEVLSVADMANGLENGVVMAYKAVMKPREGTVLTVSRAFSDAAHAYLEASGANADFIEMMKSAVAAGNETLERTPEMLDVLKQAGVVDSGGKGLMIIYEGWLCSLTGEEFVLPESSSGFVQEPENVAEEEIQVFEYHVSFLIRDLQLKDEADIDRLQGRLTIIGGNVSVKREMDSIHVFVDTDMPGKVIQYALRFGKLVNIGIKNLLLDDYTEEQVNGPATPQPKKAYGMVVVAVGDGFKNIFHELQVDGFVEGGQTMNPSTEDIYNAIVKQNAECVYVFPNNGNIVMAAQQAAEMANCEVHVIPTKTVPQGIAAVLAFNPEASAEDNETLMQEVVAGVKTGEVTYAIRDSSFNGLSIHKGDIMGMNGKEILNLGNSIPEVTIQLIEKMYSGEGLMTLYYGQDVSEEDAIALSEVLRDRFPDCDIDIQSGGQPLYYYILSLE